VTVSDRLNPLLSTFYDRLVHEGSQGDPLGIS